MIHFRKKKWIVIQKEKGELKDSEIISAQKISRMTLHRIWKSYQEKGLESLKDKPKGRKIDGIPFDIQKRILSLRKNSYGITKINSLLKQENISVSKRKITRVLKENNLHKSEPKKGKRYNYIRWQRKHSNSLWQTDFCWIEKQKCWLCAWLDDHSRLVASANYLAKATTNNAIALFEKGAKRFGYPKETLSDRGTQFYSNFGEECRFLEHMKSKGVNHIYASIKKPTTCGKIERFWRTHNDERWKFDSLRRFINYYNFKRPHMSLDYRTPYQVWKQDLKV